MNSIEKIFFEEKQKFNQVGLWAILLLSSIVTIYHCEVYGYLQLENLFSLIVISSIIIAFA